MTEEEEDEDRRRQAAALLYLSAVLRHQIYLQQYAYGEVLRRQYLFELADRELTGGLRQRLSQVLVDDVATREAGLRQILSWLRIERAATHDALATTLRENLLRLSTLEAALERATLGTPLGTELVAPTLSSLRDLVLGSPFDGKLLKEHLVELRQQDLARLYGVLRQGMAERASLEQIVQRIVGTRAKQYADGALSVTRGYLEILVRGAVSHVSNAAREAVWLANPEFIEALRWTSILDGNTTAICRGRSGKYAPLGNKPVPPGLPRLDPPGARPPAHRKCRSSMWPKLVGIPLLEPDYGEWLATQSSSFQDRVLGRTKARLFREGSLPLDHFTDRKGGELTLGQLAKSEPEAFQLAGLDPSDFLN